MTAELKKFKVFIVVYLQEKFDTAEMKWNLRSAGERVLFHL